MNFINSVVHSLLQSEFFTEPNLVLFPSIYRRLSSPPQGHAVAAIVFFLLFSSLLSSHLSFLP